MLAAPEENGALFRYRFGNAEFDESRFELRVDGQCVDVQHKPLELLATLLRTPGEVVTTEEILQSVWKFRNSGDLETNVIGTALTKLRGALGKDARRIVNLPRVGYRFEGRVERVVVGRALSSGLALEPGMPVPLRHNFVLRDLLSRSRFSEVWRARHAKTDEARIYKFSPAGDRLPMLKREATLYRLLHDTLGERPDIVRVIDWNFAEAPFFLECEDGGKNLRTWAEEDARLRGLDQARRLALFLQIADAVAAAHSVGVLHKDLKPDNVLIAPLDEGWQVRLTDFGSGALLDPQRLESLGITQLGFTATQGLLGDATTGTLLYLAPELARGETPTLQSDVYALGLLLYQMLIGEMRRPLVPGWQREIGDELLQEDIAAATDGNPAHRLASVGELVARLRRLEARREELARRRALEESARLAQEQLKRARARRPWLIATAAVLVVGMAASTTLYVRSDHAYKIADAQRARAEAINKFLNDDLLGAADPSAPGAQPDPTVKQLLGRAAARLEGRFTGDLATKASIDLTIGKAYYSLNDFPQAETFLKQGIAGLESVSASSDEEAIEAEYALARTLDLRERFAEAEAAIDRADAAAGVRLRQASKPHLLSAWSRGNHFMRQLNPQLALPYFEEAERIRRALPADTAWLFHVRGALAWCYVRLNRNDDAIAALSELLQPQYTLERVGASDWSRVRMQHAFALTNLSRYGEAETVLKDALKVLPQQLGENSYTVGMAWNYLGTVYQGEARWDEAIDALTRAHAVLLRSVGEQTPTLTAAGELAISRYLSGQRQEALPQLQTAHAALQARMGTDAPGTQEVSFYLASALLDNDRSVPRVLVEHLQPEALNSVDPRTGWAERVDGLKGMILLREGNPEGRKLVAEALARLEAKKAPAWIVAPLKGSLDAPSTTLASRK